MKRSMYTRLSPEAANELSDEAAGMREPLIESHAAGFSLGCTLSELSVGLDVCVAWKCHKSPHF